MPVPATATPGRPVGAPTQEEIAVLWTIAEQAAASRLYKAGYELANAHQLFMKLLYARDLGIGVTAALSGVDIVRGKLELSASLQAALVKAHPIYDYKVVDHTEEGCSIRFTQDGVELATSTFTMADADTAGLTSPSSDGEPSTYHKYPRNMLWSRAMSNGVGWYCADVANGLRPYAQGELEPAGDDSADTVLAPTASADAVQPAVNGTAAIAANGTANGHPPPAVPTHAAGAMHGDATSNGADEERPRRATEQERSLIQQIARHAGIDDAELFNLLVVTAGGTRTDDSDGAASLLPTALQRLPIRLVAPVVAELEAVIAARKAATDPNTAAPSPASPDGRAAAGQTS